MRHVPLVIHSVGLAAVLAGIVWRGRTRAAVLFPAYLLVGLVHNLLQLTLLDPIEDWRSWLFVDLVQRLLCLGVGVEIGFRVFHRELPGGRVWFRRVLSLVLILGGISLALWFSGLGAMSDRQLYDALFDASRRLSTTSVWVYTVLAFLAIVYYNWPMDPYHAEILVGLCVYQIAVALFSPGAVFALGWNWPVWVYALLLGLWCRSAWRRDRNFGMEPDEVSFVWPWRSADRC